MKKLISILVCTITVLSFTGCGSTKPKETVNSKTDTANVSNTNSPQKNKTKDEEEGMVLFEDEYAKITYAGIDRDYDLGPRIDLVIENKCDQALTIQADQILVDDYSAIPVLSSEILPGKKIKDTMTLLSMDVQKDFEVQKDFKYVEGKFKIMPKDEFGKYLKEEPFAISFTSSGQKQIKEEGKVIFEDEYAKITYIGIERDGYGGPNINLKIENKSAQNLTIQAADVLVDGYMVDPQFSYDIFSGNKIKGEISFVSKGVSSDFRSIEGNFIITPKDKLAELLKKEPFTIKY